MDLFSAIVLVMDDIFTPVPPRGYLMAPMSIRQEESKGMSSSLLRTVVRLSIMAAASISSMGRQGTNTGKSK
jgi:hypothetical protein